MKRVKTGIKGFDELVQGGFPEGSSTLITGSPGTGKSIFGLQFVYNGAVKYGEKGLYVSFEQRKKDLIEQAGQFGWNLPQLVKSGKLEILSIPLDNVTRKTIDEFKKKIVKEKVKRLVIDSLTTLTVNAPILSSVKEMSLSEVVSESTVLSPPIIGDFLVKHFIYSFIESLHELEGVTSILVSDSSTEQGYMSRDTVSEFVCDGVILLNFEALGSEFTRSLLVRKMRQTKNDEDVHPLEIGKNGLMVHEVPH
ncbi:AAA family ATPase [Candidatus Woesearchaeota archaeon]|nr:AAA family ATPase [Candidatus Woesearchaeota archaeon]